METNSAENTENSTKNTVINKQNEEVNLLSLSVVRRDGSITPFKSDKIANPSLSCLGCFPLPHLNR